MPVVFLASAQGAPAGGCAWRRPRCWSSSRDRQCGWRGGAATRSAGPGAGAVAAALGHLLRPGVPGGQRAWYDAAPARRDRHPWHPEADRGQGGGAGHAGGPQAGARGLAQVGEREVCDERLHRRPLRQRSANQDTAAVAVRDGEDFNKAAVAGVDVTPFRPPPHLSWKNFDCQNTGSHPYWSLAGESPMTNCPGDDLRTQHGGECRLWYNSGGYPGPTKPNADVHRTGDRGDRPCGLHAISNAIRTS